MSNCATVPEAITRGGTRRGSILMVAMLTCGILTLVVGGILTVAMNERRNAARTQGDSAAFHLAEAGLDLAAESIVKGYAWVSTGGGTYRTTETINGRDAVLAIKCTIDTSSSPGPRYVVRSVAEVVSFDGKIVSRRALSATFRKPAAGGFPWPEGIALTGRISAKLNTSATDNRITIASYDSSKLNFPYLKPSDSQLSFQSGVAVGGPANGALEIFNARILGTVQTGGGNIAYQADHPPIVTVDETKPTQFDSSLVTKDFEFAFPDIPDAKAGVDGSWSEVTTYKSQNAFSNASGTITFGASPTSKTYVEIVDQVVISSNKKVVVNGEVVINHKNNDLFQLSGAAVLDIRPGAKLRVITAGKVQADQGFSNTWAPKQLEVFTSNTQEVVLKQTNAGRFYAPNAKLHLADGAYLMGQVVAKTTDITNGSHALYDLDIGSAGDADASLVMTDWHQIVPDEALVALLADEVAN